MTNPDSTVAVYADHEAADAAVQKLAKAGSDMKSLSIVGKGFHSEEKVVGFYTDGDRVRFWGTRGAFWGGFWGLFFGGLMLTVPVTGPVVVLGFLAASVISAIEGALVVGGLSAIGAALFGIGIPKDSVVEYETAVRADGFLVLAQGSAADMAHARAILEKTGATRMDAHAGSAAPALAAAVA